MKNYIIILSLLIAVLCLSYNGSKSETHLTFKNLNLSSENVYVVLRGSEAKLAGYARYYNDSNLLASHVGLMLHNGKEFTIYHVHTDKKDNQSHLIEESLTSFFNDPSDPFIYASLWELQQDNSRQVEEIHRQIKSFQNQTISFDYDFNNNDNNRLYCSEFVYKILNGSDTEDYYLEPSTKTVDEGHRFFLQKDTIQVYPVDFFLKYNNVKIITEWISNESPL